MKLLRVILVFVFSVGSVVLSAQQKTNPPKKVKSKPRKAQTKNLKNTNNSILPAVEIDIGKGDTALIGKTSAAVFYHLDMYKRTRWAPEAPAYDTATGNGFYQSFFKGDYDAAELPASYSGQKLVILGVEVLKNKNTGKDMNIMYLYGDLPNSIVWVDFDEAIATGEISFIPAKSKMASN